MFRRRQLEEFAIERITVMARAAGILRHQHPQLLVQGVELLDSDITTCNTLPKADFILHAAASTDARNYLARPQEERRNIQAGTLNFCALAERFCRDSRVVYASSGAVYGQQPAALAEVPEDYAGGALSEMSPEKHDYAAAKRDGELAVSALGKAGLSVSVARCFAFVGPFLPRNQHFAIGNFIEDGLRGRPISVSARHSVIRSYMHADDLVRWLLLLAGLASNECPVMNVGSDQGILIGDLAKMVARYFSVAAEVPELSSDRVDRYVPSIERARTAGLHLHFDLKSALDRTVQSIHEYAPGIP